MNPSEGKALDISLLGHNSSLHGRILALFFSLKAGFKGYNRPNVRVMQIDRVPAYGKSIEIDRNRLSVSVLQSAESHHAQFGPTPVARHQAVQS